MMEADIGKAKVAIETEGAFVSIQADGSLFIGAGSQTFDGLQVFRENATLYHCDTGWRGVFPAQGIAAYEVDADLSELTTLLIRVIRESNNGKYTWATAFQRVVANSADYLHRVS